MDPETDLLDIRAPGPDFKRPGEAPSLRPSLRPLWLTMRYDRARKNLDRHPDYILAAYMASGT